MVLEQELPSHCFDSFFAGYADDSIDRLNLRKVAGLISLAYASFYDFDRRMMLGKDLLT